MLHQVLQIKALQITKEMLVSNSSFLTKGLKAISYYFLFVFFCFLKSELMIVLHLLIGFELHIAKILYF